MGYSLFTYFHLIKMAAWLFFQLFGFVAVFEWYVAVIKGRKCGQHLIVNNFSVLCSKISIQKKKLNGIACFSSTWPSFIKAKYITVLDISMVVQFIVQNIS